MRERERVGVESARLRSAVWRVRGGECGVASAGWRVRCGECGVESVGYRAWGSN